MRFIDEAIITVRAGKGGNGCVAFRREKFIAYGGPNGGNGGNGGNVYVQGCSTVHSLQDVRLHRLYEAENGRPGQGKQCDGRAGEDCIIFVPLGTVLFEQKDGAEVYLADIVEERPFLVASGGRGGKGNEHFKTSTMRTPRFAQKGEAGEEKRIRMELKILADVGIIGLPNAGKSTLISVLSAARPVVASYPFTTITPNLGVMIDDCDPDKRIVLADIPGLVEGAHLGVGLGHSFLRHVERTRFLVHLLSAEDVAIEDPWAGFELINEELRLFNEELALRPQLMVVNKVDLLPQMTLESLVQRAEKEGKSILFISSAQGYNIEALKQQLWLWHDQYAMNHPLNVCRAVCDFQNTTESPSADIEVVWVKE